MKGNKTGDNIENKYEYYGIAKNTYYTLGYVKEREINYLKTQAELAAKTIEEKSGAGNDFLGWVDLPVNYDKEEFARIKLAAEKIQKQSEVLIVIGIGGSYLGAKATIDFLSNTFYNNLLSIF